MKKPIQLSEYVKPINLPKYKEELPEGSTVIVTGFGTTSNNTLSPNLKKLVTRTFSNYKCNIYFKHLVRRNVLPTHHICAERRRGDGTCTVIN